MSAEVAATAAALGVAERTVWRRMSSSPAPRPRFALSPTDIDAFSDFCGNVAAVHRARSAAIAGQRTAAGAPIDPVLVQGWAGGRQVDLRTLQRAFARELTPAFVAGVTVGQRARRAKLVYLERAATFRNQVWEGDHKCLPVLVLPPRGRAVAPWVTMFLDDATRLITGWAIALTPHAGTVLTALRMGMLDDPAYGVAHGVPRLLRLDRGLEFAAAAVTTATSALGTEIRQLPGYHPHRKGKIERAFLTVDQTLLCTLPGYTGGPRRLNGALDGPVDDRLAAREAYGDAAAAGDSDGLPLGLETFARIFSDWVAAYNTGHVHSELGCTPEQAWRDDPSPVEDVPEEQLRHLLLAGTPRTIGPHGIRFRNLNWVDAGGLIRQRRGQRVQIRYMPYDDRQIHVYVNGEFLATCLPRDALTPGQEEEFYAAARAQEKQAAAQRSAARKRGRRRLATLSADSEAAESVRRISPAEADRLAAAAPPKDLGREASTSLLGLRPIGAIEPVDLAAMDVREEGRPW
ncbi:MAG TPA: transposase family protein [Nonomuraea sp.]|nr:transposase family protein [Nonomuraea sp.]